MTLSRGRSTKQKKVTSKKAAVRVFSRAQVPGAVKRMAAPSGTARFAAGKALSVTAERDPCRVYPHFDRIASLLDGESKVVRWNALQIIAALAPADSDRKLDAILDKYLAFIRCGNLISAANAIRGAGRIALARLELADRIIPALLSVEAENYETAECRNVAIGHALAALEELGSAVCRRPAVAKFIRRQMANPRTAVARCAKRLTAELAAGE